MKKISLFILSGALLAATGSSLCTENEYRTDLSSQCTKFNDGLLLHISEMRRPMTISAADLEFFVDNKELVIDKAPQAIDVDNVSTLFSLMGHTKYEPIWADVTTLIFGSAENFPNEKVTAFSNGLQKIFPNIKTLYLGYLGSNFQFSQNFLNGIGRSFQEIETLAMAGNGIKEETIRGLSKYFSSLKVLAIQSNLNEGAIEALEGFRNLETLNLSKCGLSFPNGLSFPELPALQKLNLSHNKIESVISFSQLPKLESLDLSHNPLAKGKQLAGLEHTQVKLLNLNDTGIFEHELGECFRNVKSLKEISIKGTLAGISPTLLWHPTAKFITN